MVTSVLMAVDIRTRVAASRSLLTVVLCGIYLAAYALSDMWWAVGINLITLGSWGFILCWRGTCSHSA